MAHKCTRAQIRELDRRAIEEYGVPGVVLMENAGRGAAMVALEMLGDPRGKFVVVFCGRGNNGGDGFVVARFLHNLGARIECVLACPEADADQETDAGINFRIVRRMGIHLHVADSDTGQFEAAGLEQKADLIVDALLGTGLMGEVREPCLSLVRLINAADKPVLSIDIPSGLDADTGRLWRAAVRATVTVTFVLPKAGFYLGEGPAHVGKVRVVDIGVPRALVEQIE